MATGLSISTYINQVVAGQPRKPSPIHDALQSIQNWAAAGLTTNDLAANAGILISQTELAAYSNWATWAPTVTLGGTLTASSTTVNLARSRRLGNRIEWEVDI